VRRVFKTRHFTRWAHRARLADDVLCAAVVELARGLIDADLGGGVVKKRVPMPGRGKRGGARALLATNRANLWFYLAGFAKNERDNVSADELAAPQTLAADLLGLTPQLLDSLTQSGALKEICHDDEIQEPRPPSRSPDRT
jgi:hypothetical protein